MTEYERNRLYVAIGLIAGYLVYLGAEYLGNQRNRKAARDYFIETQRVQQRWIDYIQEEAIGRKIDEI